MDEARAAEVFLRELSGRTIAKCLAPELPELLVVEPDAAVLEAAALMACARSPLVAVVGRQDGMLGAIMLDARLKRLVGH